MAITAVTLFLVTLPAVVAAWVALHAWGTRLRRLESGIVTIAAFISLFAAGDVLVDYGAWLVGLGSRDWWPLPFSVVGLLTLMYFGIAGVVRSSGITAKLSERPTTRLPWMLWFNLSDSSTVRLSGPPRMM